MTGDGFEQVKDLMRIVGGKAIIVEDGKPAFVIVSADEYLGFSSAEGTVGSETELIEKINKDITIWKGKQKERELGQMEKELKHKDRAIEIVSDNENADI